LIRIFALACGLAAANLYYAQPMLGIIGASFGVGAASTGLIVTCTQLGYAVGLLLVVPLGDMLENRRLVTTVMCATVLALLGMAAAPSLAFFAVAALVVGLLYAHGGWPYLASESPCRWSGCWPGSGRADDGAELRLVQLMVPEARAKNRVDRSVLHERVVVATGAGTGGHATQVFGREQVERTGVSVSVVAGMQLKSGADLSEVAFALGLLTRPDGLEINGQRGHEQ